MSARPSRPAISTGPRVGVSQAADIPWRFWMAEDPTVCPYRPAAARRKTAKTAAALTRQKHGHKSVAPPVPKLECPG